MWSPDVLSSKAGFQSPTDPKNSGAFRSPAAGLARYAELKTRCIEHNWLQNKPSGLDEMTNGKWIMEGANPDQISLFVKGRTAPQANRLGQPWWYNEASMSAPNALFFDGHVGISSVLDAKDADDRVTFQNSTLATKPKALFDGIFVKKAGITSLTNSYQWGTYDNVVANYKNLGSGGSQGVAHHVLTVDGILGRDLLSAK